MSEYFDCGYARVAIRETLFKDSHIVESNYEKRMTNFLAIFNGPSQINFQRNITTKQFTQASKKLLKIFKDWKGDEKKNYLTYFSSTNWRGLSENQKKQHTRMNCQGCMVHHHITHCKFPVKNARHLTSKPINLTEQSKNIAKNLNAANPQPTKEAIKSAVQDIYKNINEPFVKVFGINFNEAQAKVPSLDLQMKQSESDRKKTARDWKRKEKLHIEKQWAERDCENLLSTRQSLAQREKLRLLQHFETKDEAQQRAEKRKAQEQIGNVNKKKHSPDPSDIDFDKEGVLNEVRQMTSGDKVKIQQGDYVVGELIVPRRYKKLILDENGVLKEKTFTVTGRKVTLLDIRKRELQRLERLGVVRGYTDYYYDTLTEEDLRKRLKELDEYDNSEREDVKEMREVLKDIERRRHLIWWGDNSTVLNHGHLMMMVSSVYDKAFYYTDEEMLERGIAVDVQSLVETPHIYILGRCKSSEIEQLAYIATRAECLQELDITINTQNGVEIIDIMRFFHADGPEQQGETGEQRGGFAGCVSCSSDSRKYDNITNNFRNPCLSLQDRVDIVRKGPAGRSEKNGGLKPFQGLTETQLANECRARGLDDFGKKKELEERLKKELGGIQRLPAMLLPPNKPSLRDMNLSFYEVLPTEPLHDVKEQIKNVMEEIPKHLTKGENSEFKKLTEIVFGGKDKVRGTDYRKGCIATSKNMHGKWRNCIQRIFDTMAEVSKFCYAGAKKRTPKSILRFHNQTFLHAMWCKILVGKKPKALTRRKFYGRYFHSLTVHAPIVYRIISLSSIHTEEEERTFSTVNSIASTTTSRRHDEIIAPTLIRLQAEQKRKALDSGSSYQSSFSKQNSEISKLSATFPPSENTIIPHFILLKYPHEYQAHLERISDFLLPGENIWWSRDIRGVEFHDGDSEPAYKPEGPTLHHFRYSTIPTEQQYLQQTWLECIEKGVTIPHVKLTTTITNDDGSTNTVERETSYFYDDEEEEDDNDEVAASFSTDLVNAEEPSLGKDKDIEEDEEENFDELDDDCDGDEIGFVIVDEMKDGFDSEDEGTGEKCTLVEGMHQENLELFKSSVESINKEDGKGEDCLAGGEQSTTSSTSLNQNLSKCQPNTDNNSIIMKNVDRNAKSNGNYVLKTDLAKNVSKIVSDAELVNTLDKTRSKWKANITRHGLNSNASKTFEDAYLDILAKVQTKVLAAFDPLENTLKASDEKFFLQHNQREPQVDDYIKDEEDIQESLPVQTTT